MKKIICIFISIVLMLSVFSGCAKKSADTTSDKPSGTSSQSAGNSNSTTVSNDTTKEESNDNTQNSGSSSGDAQSQAEEDTNNQGTAADNTIAVASTGSSTSSKNNNSTGGKNTSVPSPAPAAAVNLDDVLNKAVLYLEKNAVSKDYVISDWDAVGLRITGRALGSNFIENKGTTLTKEIDNYYMTDYARTILGVMAAGYDPGNFQGIDLVGIVKNSMMENGKFKDTISGGEELVNCHVWSIIALEAAGADYDREKALKYLEGKQNKDGGFYIFAPYPDSDVDFTAMSVLALTMAGRDSGSPSVLNALKFLKGRLAAMEKDPGLETAETLSVILEAITASGDDVKNYKINGRSIVDELLNFWVTNGGFKHLKTGSVNEIATRQAVTALGFYKSSKNMYRELKFKKGNYYAGENKEVPAVRIHSALYDVKTGTAEFKALAENIDEVDIEITDGKDSYSEALKPENGLVSITKQLPESNYDIIIKGTKAGNVVYIYNTKLELTNEKITVSVRIESYDKNLLYEENLSTGTTKVYDYDGTAYPQGKITVYSFVMNALNKMGIKSNVSYSYGAPFITAIDGTAGGKFGGWDGWMYFINGADPGIGMTDAEVKSGDEILVYYGDWGIKPLEINVPETASKGQAVEASVYADGKAVEGAVLWANGKKYITGADGKASITIDETKNIEIFAEKLDDIGKPLFVRSAKEVIEVK